MPNSQINLPPKPEAVQAVWGSTQDVMTKICCKRTKLSSLMNEDSSFPKPIRLSKNHIRWNLAEIDAWISAQEAKRA
ncbi:AlpA family transcriptional regulator [Glaesserella parasuis]|nr:AlpA family transcriptional regulator [Glaesserella parasuis]MDE4008305.1 AlpA family transcriptional regulator [Glaesserella parasuis]MDE4027890.1 AlpA family transcriptional regulator [Glaesserella parasuis]MDE4050941.1 AlpA family transcriptional regulator [Glaesserella parasuis]